MTLATVVTVFQLALICVVTWMVLRGLVTGRMTLNWRVVQRTTNPIGYWFTVGVGFFLIYLLGASFVQSLWR